MAWYGVNFVLGKGLHSYGFGIGGETYVAIGVVLDLLFVGFAIWRYRSSKSAGSSAPAEAVAIWSELFPRQPRFADLADDVQNELVRLLDPCGRIAFHDKIAIGHSSHGSAVASEKRGRF